MTERILEILYVDDEEINLELFKLSFRNLFYIHTAKSAKEGLAILEETKIPLVITDYKMPEMNGIKFIEEIKKKSPDKICIILTGFIDAVTKGKENLVFSLIQKPWRKEEVRNIIQSGFDHYYKQNS